MIRSLLSALLAVAAVVAAAPASALDWSDNSLRYQFGPSFAEPAVTDANGASSAISKNIVSFQHVDGYKYGGNFFVVNVLLSSTADKANGPSGTSTAGATEVYAIYRHDLSLNKATGSKAFAFGPIRDVLFEAGADLSAKNTAFAAQVLKPVVGPVLSIAVPGFWDIGVLAEKEWNNNGVVGKRVEFDPTVMFATSWGIPVYGAFSFEGFGNVILPKGKDGFGAQTKTELLVHPRVMWDAGSLFNTKGYQIGVGYEYWLNKFGDDHNLVTAFGPLRGAEQSTVVFEAALHL